MRNTVFITGGSKGIGAATARLFAERDYNVIITYLTGRENAEKVTAEICGNGGAAVAFRCDVRSTEETARTVELALKRFGKIDVLVNNAGISQYKLFDLITPSEWNDMMNVHVNGTFNTVREVLPIMMKHKRGAIVNMASIWGETGGSTETHYSTAKAAVIGLTKSLAKELAPSGIRVNAVAPGAIDTGMLNGLTDRDLAALNEEIPLGRLGRPEEVAQAILFLAEAEYITGHILSVNGGLYI